MNVQCDTLIILDCCEAGRAAINLAQKEDDRCKFRKELTGACGWNATTGSHMSPSIWNSLRDSIAEDFDSISTSSLVRRMNSQLIRSSHWGRERSPPQAVHYVLQRHVGGKMVLPLDLAPQSQEIEAVLDPTAPAAGFETTVNGEARIPPLKLTSRDNYV
ncbi:hypothetical protein ABW21_db0206966 [Orbilia brochopaga]|nr:hypothetical protein ABW21_db0206966 [Drechslerella brochopaga]